MTAAKMPHLGGECQIDWNTSAPVACSTLARISGRQWKDLVR